MRDKLADARPNCRTAVLDAIERLHQHTGATAFARRDIVAEVQATGAGLELFRLGSIGLSVALPVKARHTPLRGRPPTLRND